MREKALWAFTYETRKRRLFHIFRKKGTAGEFDQNFEDYIDENRYDDDDINEGGQAAPKQRGKNYVQDGSSSD